MSTKDLKLHNDNNTVHSLSGSVTTKKYLKVIKSYGAKWNGLKKQWDFTGKHMDNADYLYSGIRDDTIGVDDIYEPDDDEEKDEKDEKDVEKKADDAAELAIMDDSNPDYVLIKTKPTMYNKVIKKNGGKYDYDLRGWCFTGYSKAVGKQVFADIMSGVIKPELSIEKQVENLSDRFSTMETQLAKIIKMLADK